MKKQLLALLLGVVTLFSVSSQALTWDQMSQQQKNNALLQYAMSWPTGSYGNQCKIWVNTIVQTISWKSLPATYPNDNGYQWYPAPKDVVQRFVSGPQYFQPGDIIQMNYTNAKGVTYPHTAFVVGLYYGAPGGVVFIDSNWSGNGLVQIHNVGFDVFARTVGNRFSVYNIK